MHTTCVQPVWAACRQTAASALPQRRRIIGWPIEAAHVSTVGHGLKGFLSAALLVRVLTFRFDGGRSDCAGPIVRGRLSSAKSALTIFFSLGPGSIPTLWAYAGSDNLPVLGTRWWRPSSAISSLVGIKISCLSPFTGRECVQITR
jgi:hypothetical protein